MLESIYVGMTGLLGFSRGLRVIANNTANLNTPGFKSSSVQFSDLFYTGGNLDGGVTGRNPDQLGFGLNTLGTSLSFKQGELRQTGNELDLGVDGQGLFILQDDDGALSYSRAGQFGFNTAAVLVSRGSGAKVMGMGSDGSFAPITLTGQMANSGQATTRVKFTGNLSSTTTSPTVGSVKVIDPAGTEHTLSLVFSSTDPANPGRYWRVDVQEGGASVGSGQISFSDGRPVAGASSFSIQYAPAGQAGAPLTFDFGTDVTAFASGTLSTLAMSSQDGIGPGALTSATFNATGALVLGYSNGQNVTGPRLALARFDTPDSVIAKGANEFAIGDRDAWHFGIAGEGAFGKVRSGVIEISNVDLSSEFSDLVVMQRGYQASSQVISTANDMLQELFSMKSR